ncbi:RNA pseudouridine synthase 4, mitochondrial [Rhododendron vialii]|uniref:RNA pseudouridine synthase 4, mitochondrial n=1 Tax=Rhododendron vialii TaxID=182163 RepID=UPI00265EDA53|nr:RNA pseudouridine synthase 4, mitochondrial [Rhododendron vialii]
MNLSSALFRRAVQPFAAASRGSTTLPLAFQEFQSQYSTATTDAVVTERKDEKSKGKWFTLPPFNKSTVDGAALGKELSGRRSDDAVTATTALKWVLRCCPQLPRSLVQKLFRLRQVRRESSDLATSSDLGVQTHKHKLTRVAAKDQMNVGDQIFLPITVQEFPSETGKPECFCDEEEMEFLRSLELYKDSAIIVVNKPPGMPVQGGAGIRNSLDEVAASYLRYDYTEPPRLVHRLDRDSSGILVMGRTQTSARVLHSIFREKTSGASSDDLQNIKRTLQRRYWALVIGYPRRSKGIISVPLKKMIVDDGKSERITVANDAQVMSSQHAITEYRVIKSSCNGYTWLELSPLTGRKHQLRVHCAEVLGTPIVGDYKYGWQAHRKMKHLPGSIPEKLPKGKRLPFGLELEKGSILEKQPLLHLHCKEMVLPNVSSALHHVQLSSGFDLSGLESLKLTAPLPSHMEKSWNILNS